MPRDVSSFELKMIYAGVFTFLVSIPFAMRNLLLLARNTVFASAN